MRLAITALPVKFVGDQTTMASNTRGVRNTKAARHTPNRLSKLKKLIRGCSGHSLFGRLYADEPAMPALIFKFYDAGHQRKKRIVLALTDVHSSLMLGATLPHQNRACVDQLPAKSLDAQPLTV